MAASPQLFGADSLARELSSLVAKGGALERPTCATGRIELDEALPGRGLPASAVVELCGPSGLGGMTGVALSACAAAQQRARQREEEGWCAWVDASHSLYAPGLARSGVDLERLLVVRPEPHEMARVAVRLVQSRAFSMVVIDRAGVPGVELPRSRNTRWNTAVRRLALAAEQAETTILLLSRSATAQRETLPVAMRLELGRPSPDRLRLRVAKDKRGRLTAARTIPWSAVG